MMAKSFQGFAGFAAGKTRFTCLPNAVFTELLPIIDDLAELKVVLYTFWRLDQGEGDIRYVRMQDVLVDLLFLEGFGETPEAREQAVRDSFSRAAQRGVLIEVQVLEDKSQDDEGELIYFLNSAKGRDAVARIRRGEVDDLRLDLDDVAVDLSHDRPNIFLLYEQNIGMITPMMSEKLRQAERDYPDDWIRDAFAEAIANNKRSWAYIARILQNWAEHGQEKA